MREKFKALGHDVRLTMYRALRREKLCVCELTELLDRSQSAVSQHLSKLREADLIDSERIDQWHFYSLSDADFHRQLEGLFEESFDQLDRELKSIVRQKDLCDLRDEDGQLPN